MVVCGDVLLCRWSEWPNQYTPYHPAYYWIHFRTHRWLLVIISLSPTVKSSAKSSIKGFRCPGSFFGSMFGSMQRLEQGRSPWLLEPALWYATRLALVHHLQNCGSSSSSESQSDNRESCRFALEMWHDKYPLYLFLQVRCMMRLTSSWLVNSAFPSQALWVMTRSLNHLRHTASYCLQVAQQHTSAQIFDTLGDFTIDNYSCQLTRTSTG